MGKVYTLRRRNCKDRRVGLIYDEKMCRHFTPDGEAHPENPNRIKAIWKKLESAGITQRCMVYNAKKAEDKHMFPTHTKKHINLIRDISSRKLSSHRKRSASKFNSIYFNEGSSEAAYLAAGSVIELVKRVAKGEINSAFAIVRPPGHHAEKNEPMGFCLFNNVAIAASFLLNERPDLGIKKILIVDWDVHHGNGTQKMFWKDPRVLVFSVHRHDFGKFYPENDDGCFTMIGEGAGKGYNINVPWEDGGCGDADYLAVWEHILIPVAKDFNPDLTIISAGFDAAVDDPLGGCCVTPCGFSIMLNKLMGFAHGKIVMALEGGYNLDSLANSVLACVEGLLENKPRLLKTNAYPLESTWSVIKMVRKHLSSFWPILADEFPKKITNWKAPVAPDSTAQINSKLECMESKLMEIAEDMDSLKTSLENIENFVSDTAKRMEIFLSDSRRYFVEKLKHLGDQIVPRRKNVQVPPASNHLPPRGTELSDDDDDDGEEADSDADDTPHMMDTPLSFDVLSHVNEKSDDEETCNGDENIQHSIARFEFMESKLTTIAQDMISLKSLVKNFENFVSDSMLGVENSTSDYHCYLVKTVKCLEARIASRKTTVQVPHVSHQVPPRVTEQSIDDDEDGDTSIDDDDDKPLNMNTSMSFDVPPHITNESDDEESIMMTRAIPCHHGIHKG